MAMIFPYFELVASLVILLLAFRIWTSHYENSLARFFATFAVIAFAATVLEYSSRIAFTLDLGRDIDRLSSALWVFVFPAFAHFAILFTKKEGWLKQKAAVFWFYLFPAVVAGLFLFTNIMYLRYEIWSVGIVSIPSAWSSLFLLDTVFFAALAVVLLWQYSFKSHQQSERLSARLIAAGVLLPLVVGVVTDELLPLIFGTRLTPPTAVFDLAVMNLFIYFAMRNYSLFAISPALAAETIIETMPDSLIVTDIDGRVLLLNEEAHKFFHAPKEAIIGRCIADLFIDKNKYDQLYCEVVEKKL
jgi:hypothetical protein